MFSYLVTSWIIFAFYLRLIWNFNLFDVDIRSNEFPVLSMISVQYRQIFTRDIEMEGLFDICNY